MTTWSLEPLLYYTLSTEACQTIFADISVVKWTFFQLILLGITYPIIHNVLSNFEQYKLLGDHTQTSSSRPASTQQVTVLHHAVEFVVLSVLTPIFSYYIFRTNFQVHFDFNDVLPDLRAQAIMMGTITIMYMMEIASRFKDQRLIVVFHHIVAVADGLLLLIFPTSVMYKTGIVLVYFVCFESLTFAGLLMYRLFPTSPHTSKVILSGMVCFGLTRPIQVLWIAGAVFGSWGDENVVKWQAILQICVTFIVTTLQVYTLRIHYSIWQKCLSKQEQEMKMIAKKHSLGVLRNPDHSSAGIYIENSSLQLEEMFVQAGRNEDDCNETFISSLAKPDLAQQCLESGSATV